LTGTVDFPDASPDLSPVIGPDNVTLDVLALGAPGRPWTLSVIANSDLLSGPEVIPAGDVSWTVVPDPPYRAGSLSKSTPFLVGTGLTHERRTATFSFYLDNSWSHAPGNYGMTATFTLTSP
jgi:hypothetical protein